MPPTYSLQTVALALVLMGYESYVLAMVTHTIDGSAYSQTLLIVAFLLYTITVILIILTQFDALILDLVVAAVVIAFMIVTAIFVVIGVMLSTRNSRDNPYAAALYISSAALAIAVAVFITLTLHAVSHNGRTTAS